MDKKEKLVGSLGLLFMGIIFLIVGYFISKPESPKKTDYAQAFAENVSENSTFICSGDKDVDESNDISEENKIENSYITVDIKGAVCNPGAYKLKEGSRIKDLIKLAGGFTKEADEVAVHLSKKLYDEDFIYVKKINEDEREDIPINNSKGGKITGGHEKNESKYVNINTASIDELKSLPGIGEVKAKSIINYRESNNGFNSIDELLNVKGIGDATYNNLSSLVDIK